GLAVGDPPAGIPLSPNSGVTVFVTASRANELAPTAHALAAALMAEGLIAGVTASAGSRMEQRPNVIVIEIGRKPSWASFSVRPRESGDPEPSDKTGFPLTRE